MKVYLEFMQHKVFQKNLQLQVTAQGAVVEFGKDSSRETIIFVDELNENELREFVKQNGLILNEIEIKKVIDSIGSNPGALKALGIHMQKDL